ncbi:hypothetical protein AVEN_84830-1 [Araneus ventricosus]|uniref:Uncharacterized protein n=1 Tax=Araneus ventricosus TaxID=182803 RepID=A0A4Y2IXS7_ARAVE|nr:hypothetical protein AVEN_84830-1 [Araneus ventricosus]
MSLLNKKPQLHVKRKRKAETETTPDRQSPVKFEKIQDAKTEDYYSILRYAQMTTGDEMYAEDSEGSEIPLNLDDKPTYTVVKKIINDTENLIQVPPVSLDCKVNYINECDRIVYPMNLTTRRPMFPLNDALDEEYLADEIVTEPHYPIDAEGKSHYARRNNGDEKASRIRKEFFTMRRIGMDASGYEMYCVNSEGAECYLPTLDPEKVYVLNENGEKRYSQTKGGKEIYADIKEQPVIIRNK